MRQKLSILIVSALLACASAGSAQSGARRIPIRVDEQGYHPGTVRARPGETLTLVFTRTTERGCGGTLVVPSLDLRRELPLNRPVEVTLTVPEPGAVSFTCGMGMYRGSVVVE